MSTPDSSVVVDALEAFVNTGTPREAIAVLRARSDALLTDDALHILDRNLARLEGDAGAQGVFGLRRRAIEAARAGGVEAGVAVLYRPDPELQRLVAPLVDAPGYAAMIHQIRVTPALATADASEYLGVLATWNAGNPAAANRLGAARALVDIAREEDVEAARKWLLGRVLDTVRAATDGEDLVSGWETALDLADAGQEPVTHAQIQVNLGQAYRGRGLADDPDRAVDLLTRSLDVLTREAHPADFSGVHRVLGNIAFGDHRLPEAMRYPRAIAHYEIAAQTVDAQADPDGWLHLNFQLGFCRQWEGDAAAARIHLRRGLDAIDRAYVAQAVATCESLARLMNGGGAETAAALDEALDRLWTRLEQLPPDGDAAERAGHCFTLAGVHREMLGPARAWHLERAIAASAAAARIWTRDVDANQWARMQHDLGTAYGMRLEGEKADNIEQAIQCYQDALTVHTREAYPKYWALTHNALGAAWLERRKGRPDDNAEVAAGLLEAAMTVWDREADARYWSEGGNMLAAAYLRLVGRAGRPALDRAIEWLERITRVEPDAHLRSRWAQYQNNLARAWLDRDDAGDVARAIDLLRRAVAATDRATESYLWATFKRNEAAAHSRIEGADADAHLDAAIAALGDALTVFDATRYPADHRDTQGKLGLLWFRRGAWAEALAAYRAAIDAAERLFGSAYTEAGRLSEAHELSAIHRDAAYCLVQLGRYDEALALHDRGKTRVLADAIALSQARFDGLAPAQQRDAAAARDEIARLEDQMRRAEGTPGRPSDAALGQALARARARLRERLGTTAAQAASATSLLALVPDGGAVFVPLLTSRGGVAFVVPHGRRTIDATHVVPLRLDIDGANDLLVGSEASPGLLRAYAAYLATESEPREIRQAARGHHRRTLADVCARLWPAVMQPVVEQLETFGLAPHAPVLIVPHGALTRLPLHAATDGDGPTVLRRFSVQYSPSLAVLAQARTRAAGAQAPARLLAIADPTGDLEFAGLECRELARAFGPERTVVLEHAAATREAVVAAAGTSSHLHFSCHGFYDWTDPLRSGLVLAAGNVLDVAEIMSPRVDLGATRLVVLSACETGLSDYARYPDELVGLNFGVLLAGAPAVISTMWAVDDRSTSLIMSELYRRVLDGEPVATALRHAQTWLSRLTVAELTAWVDTNPTFARTGRDATARAPITRGHDWATAIAAMQHLPAGARPYEHPYYWAAFTLLGDAS
jgi:CHAT domain-containing protein/tetratricopeptide (TPR) repeat protein